jgi:hypothetical protein
MNVAPQQTSPHLCIPLHCHLLPVATVSSLLQLSAEEVTPLLGYGLEFAFDLRRPKARHKMPIVFRGSVLAYRNGYRPNTGRDAGISASAEAARLQWVLDSILSLDAHRLSIRATDLKKLLGYCDRKHVIRLMRDGMLRADLTHIVGRGAAQSPWILRASVMGFLRSRRIL